MTDDREQLGDTGDRELGSRIREARRVAGMTQEHVAEQLGVARTTVVAIEKGDRRVQTDELVRLGAILRRSVNELLRRGAPTSPFAVQLRAAVPDNDYLQSALNEPTAEFQRLSEDYFELERICNAPLHRSYPPERSFSGSAPEIAGEVLAQQERQRLGLGNGPIPNLRLLLEQDVGLRVFYLALPSKVAAMFAYDETIGGCIAVNASEPYERRRLSLCHEYGHFLSSRTRSEIIITNQYRRQPDHERLANSFARCFLMPADGVTRRVTEIKASKGKFVYADICTLAYYYGVSVEAFTRRLEDLKLASSGAWERLKNSGFRAQEARDILGIARPPAVDDMLPPRFRFLALQGFRDGLLSEAQLTRFLRMDRSDVRVLVESFSNSNPDSERSSSQDRL